MNQHTHPTYFTPPCSADADGLVGVGGELHVDCLLDAYRHGIFPWPVSVDGYDDPILAWWSPDPRAIIDFDSFHVARRLRRTLANSPWKITSDDRFAEVIHGCSCENERAGNTWITTELETAYCDLHQAGYAHSIEVLDGECLVGGLYGVALGSMFAAESMFHRESGASKMALVALMAHLHASGFTLVDIQQLTPHMKSCGAEEIRRSEFLERLEVAVAAPASFPKLI